MVSPREEVSDTAFRVYGVLVKQFRGNYEEASRRKGITGESLLQSLETVWTT